MAEQQSHKIRKVAVLGAGVMGAQIATHMANAKVATILFDLPAKEGEPNSVVQQALKKLVKLKPCPYVIEDRLHTIEPANYDQHLAKLKECDLVIEAIAENFELKQSLYKKIAPHLSKHTIFVTNTSGLGIGRLAETLPAEQRARFCGMHFFNPPRYMALVELIPHAQTNPDLLSQLENFLVRTIGKRVVYAKDTPNFIANRVGVFSMLATFRHAQQFNIPFEVVDQLTGPLIGRPKSATMRTADVVGLDTLVHVIQTMTDNLPDDPWSQYYQTPAWLNTLIANGTLGQKTKRGIYYKQGKDFYIYDLAKGDYRLADQKADPDVIAIAKIKDPQERFQKLKTCAHPHAQFLWHCYRDLFHYCAYHATAIADNVRDIDMAMRWGFGWRQGPFEAWQLAGWSQVLTWLQDDLQANKTMANAELPGWVSDIEQQQVYNQTGAFAPAQQTYVPRSSNPVYQRQLFPEPCLHEQFNEGETIAETPVTRLWHLGNGIAILSFKTKMNTVSNAVLDDIINATKVAEESFKGLVIWPRHSNHFSAGADLTEFASIVKAGKPDALEQAVAKFQRATAALRYCMVPTVAAVKGYVFAGGCEVAMHCDRVVAASETYIGLVEAGIGGLPAGGGCKEFALRASRMTRGHPLRLIPDFFELVAKAVVSSSAVEGIRKGYLRYADKVIMNPDEILHVAMQQALAMADANYRPPLRPRIKVVGAPGIAQLKAVLVNMLEGNLISEHDYFVSAEIAHVLCGGEVDANTIVDEAYLLQLEREGFVKLVSTDKTQERIAYILKNGKPLRN